MDVLMCNERMKDHVLHRVLAANLLFKKKDAFQSVIS